MKKLNLYKALLKRFFIVPIGGGLVLDCLPVIFCDEWHWSEENRMTKNNFLVI